MDYKKLMPNTVIGIIGAGQLGKMLAQSAQKMGYRVHLYDPNPSACGFGVCHQHYCASFDDRQALMDFAKEVDVLTYEFENINGEILKELSDTAYLPQGTKLLLTAQNRIAEKEWLQSIDSPVVDFMAIRNEKDLDEAVNLIGLPAIVKTTRLGYDGKGQLKLSEVSDLEKFKNELVELLKTECIYERLSDFEYEVSVMVVRDVMGHIETFPVSYNIHEKGVLTTSLAPAPIPDEVEKAVRQEACHIAKEANLVGLLGIEFFVESSRVVINEMAPRPHNTGHYTMEACNVSQYDEHILAICGRPLIPVELLKPALMVNIMGQHMPLLEETMSKYPEAIYHLYDKGEAKFQRKMGHFTLLNDDVKQLKQLINQEPFFTKWRQLYSK